MTHDPPGSDDALPTEEIYLELRALQASAGEADGTEPDPTPAPVLADDDATGIKTRIARLRAILSDRGAYPPT